MANVLMASIVIPVNVLEDLWEMTAKQVNHVLLLNAIVVVPVLVVVLVVVVVVVVVVVAVVVVAVVVVAIEDVLHFPIFPPSYFHCIYFFILFQKSTNVTVNHVKMAGNALMNIPEVVQEAVQEMD